MKCHNDLFPLYTSLRGQHRDPSTSQHRIRLSCGCEAPTQTHKAHHQTHEAPTSFQRQFSPNEECNVVPTMIPTCPTTRARENTCPKLQKSTRLVSTYCDMIYHGLRKDLTTLIFYYFFDLSWSSLANNNCLLYERRDPLYKEELYLHCNG
jgi:hypothetical protein